MMFDAMEELEFSAANNGLKLTCPQTTDRWPIQKDSVDFFDADAPLEEQLPRKLRIDIFEREVNGKLYVFQTRSHKRNLLIR